MGKGQAFLSEEEQAGRGLFRHLNIVITEADEEQNYLVVPVTTFREKDGKPLPGQDESCILPAGCHPFIVRKSYARYSRARKMSYAEIYNGLKKGRLVNKEDISPVCLQELQRGAELSPYLPEELSRFFAYFLG
jgi:hypothetical protein